MKTLFFADLQEEPQYKIYSTFRPYFGMRPFTENKNAVLIMETRDRKAATKLLKSLPLVKSGKINFEIMELKPYSGFERIIINDGR